MITKTVIFTYSNVSEGKRMYHIFYEEVDESDVEILSIFSPTGQEPNCSELYRFVFINMSLRHNQTVQTPLLSNVHKSLQFCIL